MTENKERLVGFKDGNPVFLGVNGFAYGFWSLDIEKKTITHTKRHYEIDLTEIDTCPEILDWIFHLREKTWISGPDLLAFITAMRDLFGFDACAWGEEQGPLDLDKQIKKMVDKTFRIAAKRIEEK